MSSNTTNPSPPKPPYNPPPFAIAPSLSRFALPLSTLQTSYPHLQGLATGSHLIHPASGKLLLLQRAPADSMPLRWEVPGGAVDDADVSVLAGAARELFEEAGLVAARFVRLLGGEEPVEFRTRRGRRIGKFNFLVEVEGAGGDEEAELREVVLDPEEHVRFLWVSEDEARNKKAGDMEFEFTTPAQESTVIEAFEVWRTLGSAEDTLTDV